jgi:hypothetical protein
MRRYRCPDLFDDGPLMTCHALADGRVQMGFVEDVAGHGGVLRCQMAKSRA